VHARSQITAQRGGTLGGFLVGLLLGLVIAVGVALFVAKSPIPFMDKVSKPLERAPGAKSIADAPDPNISMYPRARIERQERAEKTEDTSAENSDDDERQAGESSSQSSGETDSKRADPRSTADSKAGTDPKRSAEPKVAAEAKRAEALLNDPRAGSGASGTSEPKAAASAAVPGPAAASYVQAGAFKVLSDAEALKARLALLGLESRVVKSEAAGQLMYRVRMGPYQRSEDVNRARNRLIEAGVDAVIVKQP